MVQYMLQTWNPKSKLDPYATSAAELTKIAKEAVNDFFEIPVGITDDLIYDLAEGFEKIFIDYTNLIACLCRVFYRSDYPMIEEDFENLKRTFCTCGEGLVNEEAVEKEAENVEGVIALMPPTTGRWNRADPNTILRVLCHRNDN